MKNALLLIDIQNDYFSGGRMTLVGSENAAVNAKLILDRFREIQQPVFHIRHLATRPDATFFLPGTAGAEIHSSLSPVKGEKIIHKHYPNAFIDTGLLEMLKNMDIQGLIICGMMTHMCVDATTRAAKDYEFNCTVIGDACASRDLEINGQKIAAQEVHLSFLAALNSYYSRVILTNSYLAE